MKTIELTKGKVTLVDDEMYEELARFKWHAANCSGSYYAARGGWLPEQKKHIIVLMHRAILRATPGTYVDHRDGNRLNNTLSNLRICTHSQNLANVNVRSDSTSGYKGVSWSKEKQRWHAYIVVGGKRKHLGYFGDIDEAANAYNVAAFACFGEFARPNVIGKVDAR